MRGIKRSEKTRRMASEQDEDEEQVSGEWRIHITVGSTGTLLHALLAQATAASARNCCPPPGPSPSLSTSMVAGGGDSGLKVPSASCSACRSSATLH